MKKLVNGKVININNIELFELAAEDLARQNTAVSVTSDGIEANMNSPLIHKYIKQYDIFFKYMPYPMYAIENDIKYATLGNFIKSLAKEKVIMWVDNGLHIKLDEQSGMTLKIVNNTWSIIYSKENKEDNTSMELFKESVGYNEYSWLLKRIINKENTAKFYTEFMPDFVAACNNQSIVLKWELENILTFGLIPNKMEFRQNKIINIDSEEEYSLDIFCTGTVETDEKIKTWSLANGMDDGFRYKTAKTYSFDAYAKPLVAGSHNNDKIQKCSIKGLHNLFTQLNIIKNDNDMTKFPVFEGAICGSNMVFTIDKTLYIAKSNRISNPVDVAHNAELYTLDKNKVYFVRSKKIDDKINKESLYSYNITDGVARLCKVIFNY